MLAPAECTDFLRLHGVHRGQAHFVEFTQGAHVHSAGVMQVAGGLMDRNEGITSIFLCHCISPVHQFMPVLNP